MNRFTWSDTDRAKLVPGCSVLVTDTRVCPVGYYEVHRVDPGGVWIFGGRVGVSLAIVDPASVKPPKQMEMFGGDRGNG